jgi:16S rRNA (guanine527-N7)-methyltransferase
MAVAAELPAEATEVFGDALGQACRYAEMLATDGVTRGLIGPRETGRLWDRHLLNCGVVAELLPERGELVDIGSGAGLPGIVLAMLRPSLRVILLEPLLRRSIFLSECIDKLELSNATVIRARAEDKAAAHIRADIATARAVAPLGRLAGWAAPLLRPGGELLAIKGQSAEEELAAAQPVLSRLGGQSAEVLQAGHGRVISATTVVRVVMGGHGREERAGAQRSRRGVA